MVVKSSVKCVDYQAAIESLKKLEGAADLLSAVETELERLTNKNFELIGENRKATTRARSLEESFSAIATTLGLEGEDLESKLASAPDKVRSLSTQLAEVTTKATTAETRATTAEGKLGTLERQSKFAQAATKAGANQAVLEKLLADQADQLAIADDGSVKVGDKPLREYVEADPTLKAFIPALFPAAAFPAMPQLPGGTPNSASPATPPNPVDTYLNKTYTAPNLTPKTEA